MLKNKDSSFIKAQTKAAIIILALLIISCIVFGILHSLYYEPKSLYRPMFYYNGTVFYDTGKTIRDADALEYIGTVNSVIPNDQIPKNDFECNCAGWLGCRIFEDGSGLYYLEANGNMFLLEESKISPHPEYATLIDIVQ